MLVHRCARVVQNIAQPVSDKSKYCRDNVVSAEQFAMASLKLTMTGWSGRKKCNLKCSAVINVDTPAPSSCSCCKNATNLTNSGSVQLNVMDLVEHSSGELMSGGSGGDNVRNTRFQSPDMVHWTNSIASGGGATEQFQSHAAVMVK